MAEPSASQQLQDFTSAHALHIQTCLVACQAVESEAPQAQLQNLLEYHNCNQFHVSSSHPAKYLLLLSDEQVQYSGNCRRVDQAVLEPTAYVAFSTAVANPHHDAATSWCLNSFLAGQQACGYELAEGAPIHEHARDLVSTLPLQQFMGLLGQGYSLVLTGHKFGGLLAHALAVRLLLQLRQEIQTAKELGINLSALSATADKVVSFAFGSPFLASTQLQEVLHSHNLHSNLHTIWQSYDASVRFFSLCGEAYAAAAREAPPATSSHPSKDMVTPRPSKAASAVPPHLAADVARPRTANTHNRLHNAALVPRRATLSSLEEMPPITQLDCTDEPTTQLHRSPCHQHLEELNSFCYTMQAELSKRLQLSRIGHLLTQPAADLAHFGGSRSTQLQSKVPCSISPEKPPVDACEPQLPAVAAASNITGQAVAACSAAAASIADRPKGMQLLASRDGQPTDASIPRQQRPSRLHTCPGGGSQAKVTGTLRPTSGATAKGTVCNRPSTSHSLSKPGPGSNARPSSGTTAHKRTDAAAARTAAASPKHSTGLPITSRGLSPLSVPQQSLQNTKQSDGLTSPTSPSDATWKQALRSLLSKASSVGASIYVPVGRFWLLEVPSHGKRTLNGKPSSRAAHARGPDVVASATDGSSVEGCKLLPLTHAQAVRAPAGWLVEDNQLLFSCWETGLGEYQRELMEVFLWVIFQKSICVEGQTLPRAHFLRVAKGFV